MKRKVTGSLNIEMGFKIPPTIELPKKSKSSLAQLKRVLKTLTNQKAEYQKLSKIIDILEEAIVSKAIATRISQKNNNLIVWVRFHHSKDAKKFYSRIQKRCLKSLGLKLELTDIKDTLPKKNVDLIRMKQFLAKIDPAFTKTIILLGGNITKVYQKNSTTLSVWVSFMHPKNVVEFLEVLKEL